MGVRNQEADASRFGLTANQMRILFSIEKYLMEKDIEDSKNHQEEKLNWLKQWSASISQLKSEKNPDQEFIFLTYSEILEEIALEHSKTENNTWYYLIILEASVFSPYYSLEQTKSKDIRTNSKNIVERMKRLKFSDQKKNLKNLVAQNEIMDEIYIDRIINTYNKALSKISGKKTKTALAITLAVAISATVAATAGALAGPIAVAIYGSNFAGLSGAALTSASLALAGGGAVAIGGGGMAGGVLAIVGGGALLGLAGGSAVAGSASLLMTASPEFTLTQAAKLEIVLKEIILNAQQDITLAQEVMERYKNEIAHLQAELTKIKLDNAEDKKMIKNMEKSIDYMEKAYQNMRIFASSYETGMHLDGDVEAARSVGEDVRDESEVDNSEDKG